MRATAEARQLPPHLPRRDEAARAFLDNTARRVQPTVLASERTILVPGELAGLLPGGGLRRGSVVSVEGALGSGATSVVLRLAAAATAVGEWAAVVDLDGTLGGVAAVEAGVVLERLAVVRRVPLDRWAMVVGVLLDHLTLVVAEVPARCRAGDARRLVARARERASILVAAGPAGTWPAEAALRLRTDGSEWHEAGRGAGILTDRTLHVRAGGAGAASREKARALALAG